ncbi:MAG: DJ-1/PfpI family protein [Planctomycetes bacterium]|nr:DJ-1/PfpI family protein [Planctomycetota bacterium]
MAKRAIVVLAAGFEEIEALVQIDLLRRAGVELTVAGLGSKSITASHAVTVMADVEISAVDFVPEMIVLPGGMPGSKNLGESEAVRELVMKVNAAGGICAAICAAPALTFAKWGLLDGRKATCYPSFEEHFPASATHSEDKVVVDGNIITSRGVGTAIDFGLMLVEQLVGADVSRKLAGSILFPNGK